MKACWWCRHFEYSQSDPGYSEYTPGNDFGMECYKNKWSFDSGMTTQDEFGAMLASAETCPDFEVKR